MTLAPARTSWESLAACRHPTSSALFFPPITRESGSQRDEREYAAKATCARCPVLSKCLEYALRVREPFGIWGGLTEAERRQRISDAPALP